jgi:abhydrolase domain-containing protein 12
LSDGSTSTIHILAVDYRGFGYSTGSPSEAGLIADGIATVNWALNVAKIPSDRIVIIGHSLGTAVTAATVEHFAQQDVNFAGVVVIAPFSDLPTLLTRYSIGGLVPLLHPIEWVKGVRRRFPSIVVDKWYSAARLSNFVRLSKRVRLFIIHARNDYEIPCSHSDAIFAAVANATTPGMDKELFVRMKERNTIDLGDGASISTWKSSPQKIIQEIIVAHGGELFLV